MIDHGADVDAQNKHWQTPLHICALSSDASSAVHIIHHLTNIDTTEEQGLTALHYAVSAIDFDGLNIQKENYAQFIFSVSMGILR